MQEFAKLTRDENTAAKMTPEHGLNLQELGYAAMLDALLEQLMESFVRPRYGHS